MTEISIPYWLKTPYVLLLKVLKFGLKKIVLCLSIGIFAISVSLFARAFAMACVDRMFS